jgi:hypothetical protein
MSLLDAIVATGAIPSAHAGQAQKKRYSEILSSRLAIEVAEGLRAIGFPNVKPFRGGPGEKAFQGGLGPKKVDVAYSDERHGLLLAVSIKSINFAPFGKNLKNRFGDLCTESITLHMCFPYAVVCMLFAFPVAAERDVTRGRPISTFQKAIRLFATVSGREEYTDPGEKFENVTMILFQPVMDDGPQPWFKFVDAKTRSEMTEQQYFQMLRDLYNYRNPHAIIDALLEDENNGDGEEK